MECGIEDNFKKINAAKHCEEILNIKSFRSWKLSKIQKKN